MIEFIVLIKDEKKFNNDFWHALQEQLSFQQNWDKKLSIYKICLN